LISLSAIQCIPWPVLSSRFQSTDYNNTIYQMHVNYNKLNTKLILMTKAGEHTLENWVVGGTVDKRRGSNKHT